MTDEAPPPKDDDGGVALKDWREAGKCSSCRFFEVDFGAPPEFHGHCKMHTRRGSRESGDYACPEYRPIAGFDDLSRDVNPAFKRSSPLSSIDLPSERSGRGGLNIPSGPAIRRPRRKRDFGAVGGSAAVVRRRGDTTESVDAGQYRRTKQPRGDAMKLFARALGGITGMGDDETEGGPAMESDALRDVLIDVIENFLGIEDVDLANKWAGGTVRLIPEDPDLKPHDMPIDTLFHKIVMIRDRLRVMEQKINAHKTLTTTEKIEMQQYLSRCYGSLTSFNVLFKHKEDKFSSK